jgi:peptidoglycan/LPS O-acetylase OafA/YrhL
MPAPGARLQTVDVLRGLAAFSVSWYHFTTANPGLPGPGLFHESGRHGWLGVDVFFVISGFIIPFALARGGYRIHDYGRFLLKRIIRLDPPYLASIACILAGLALAARVPGLADTGKAVSVTGVLLHLGYLNAFFPYPWLNVVFWTLAIEFQFYLIAGLIYPMLARRSTTARASVFVVAGLLAYFSANEELVLHWLMIFFAGAVVFQFRAGLIGRAALAGWIAGAGVVTIFTHSAAVASVVVSTALLIAFVDLPAPRPLRWLGAISYSLYLMHPLVGGRVMAWAARSPQGPIATTAWLAAAVVASLAAAWGLYWIVERPAQRWSSRIRYRAAS